MDIKYKIVEVHEQDHLIVVRYYSDDLPETELASAPEVDAKGIPVRCRTDVSISVPIPEPSDEELNKLILQYCPVVFFETMKKIKDPTIDTSMKKTKKKLNKEIKFNTDDLKANITPQILTDADVQKLLEKL